MNYQLKSLLSIVFALLAGVSLLTNANSGNKAVAIEARLENIANKGFFDKVKEGVRDIGEDARDFGEEVGEDGKELGEEVWEDSQEEREDAKEFGQDVGRDAQELGEEVGDDAEDFSNDL